MISIYLIIFALFMVDVFGMEIYYALNGWIGDFERGFGNFFPNLDEFYWYCLFLS